MFRVLLAQYRVPGRNEPVNSKAAVKYADAPVRLGMVELVALVLEHRCLAQHGETVGEPFRDEELPVVVLRQLHGHVLPVSRRTFPDVHGHVEHLALDAPHQLGLRERRPLEVQSPHHAVARHALVVLHELHVTHPRASLNMRGSMITTPSIVVFITSITIYTFYNIYL